MESNSRGLLGSCATVALVVALPLGAAFAANGGGGGGSSGGGSGNAGGAGTSTSNAAADDADMPRLASNDAEANSYFEQAQIALKHQQYYVVIEDLQKVLEKLPNNPDALNLIGFSKRKTGHPAESLDYYNRALAQNPNHLGANEYLGELYLEMKDVKKAEERLVILRKACGSCEEYSDLKEQIEKFKATSG
jgi:tetratricopeptide (TPR) repeat protein